MNPHTGYAATSNTSSEPPAPHNISSTVPKKRMLTQLQIGTLSSTNTAPLGIWSCRGSMLGGKRAVAGEIHDACCSFFRMRSGSGEGAFPRGPGRIRMRQSSNKQCHISARFWGGVDGLTLLWNLRMRIRVTWRIPYFKNVRFHLCL